MYSQSVHEVAAHPSARWRSLSDLLDSNAERTPSAPAASFPTGGLSYGELAAGSVLAARRLRAAGVGPGDRVGILLREGCVPDVTLGLGVMRLGAICVPINARNKTHELSYVMEHAGLRLLLTSNEFEGLVRDAGLPEGCELVLVDDLGMVPDGVSPEEVAALERGVDPDTAALLLYTSGTTANPKGVVHTHGTLLAVGYNTSDRLELTSADRYWTALAMFHVGGWQVLAAALAVGACFSHIGFFDADTALHQLERERCTVAFPAFETIWLAVLEHPRFADADLSALRLVIERRRPGAPGAAGSAAARAPSRSRCSAAPSRRVRLHRDGRPTRWTRARDDRGAAPRDGDPRDRPRDRRGRPRGVPGELLLRGVARFIGYHDDPADHGQTSSTTTAGSTPATSSAWTRTAGGVHRPAQGHAQGRRRERRGGRDRGVPRHAPGGRDRRRSSAPPMPATSRCRRRSSS